MKQQHASKQVEHPLEAFAILRRHAALEIGSDTIGSKCLVLEGGRHIVITRNQPCPVAFTPEHRGGFQKLGKQGERIAAQLVAQQIEPGQR